MGTKKKKGKEPKVEVEAPLPTIPIVMENW
jgi:hypothetical protein